MKHLSKYLPRYIASAALVCSPVLAFAQVYNNANDPGQMPMQQPQAQAPVIQQYQQADTGQGPAQLVPVQNQSQMTSNGIAQMDYGQPAQGPVSRQQVKQDLAQAERSGWLDSLNKTVYNGR